jgi:uncharacterized protein YbjT (DUF2867 family)
MVNSAPTRRESKARAGRLAIAVARAAVSIAGVPSGRHSVDSLFDTSDIGARPWSWLERRTLDTFSSAEVWPMPSRILISGATGMIGSLLTDELVARRVEFSVMLRPGDSGSRIASKLGVTSAEGDFDVPASLRSALEGVDRAFLLTNSSDRTEAQQIAFVEAAQAQGVRHVVYLSQLAADQRSPDRFLRYHGRVEAALMNSNVGWTFVRPNLILQAYIAFAPSIARGVLEAPIGNAVVSVVDARDIAAVAATALAEDGHVGKTYSVTGPEAVSHADVATAFGSAIGQRVRFERVPPEEFIGMLAAAGMPRWQAEGLAEDYAHYDRGEASEVSRDVQQVTGTSARRLRDFANDYAAMFTDA